MAAVSINSLDWWIRFRDPRDIWEKHPSYLVGEYGYYVLALLTFMHAARNGGRYMWMWWTTILHGLVVESLSYFVPDIDNFWHAQTSIMFLGQRLPLHIILFYPVFLYTAGVAVARMRLPNWAEPFAMGLSVVILDVPFDIMGIKLLWWTWHDTDPNIYDRHYWVPWNSYYFHATFACAFCFLFHGTRRMLTNSVNRWQPGSMPVEVICTLITALFSMPLGILQFIPIYHTLHDNFGLHTEITVLMLIVIYALIWYSADRQSPVPEARAKDNSGWFDEIGLHVVLHFTLYAVLVLVDKPEKIQAHGLHEPLGNCSLTSPVHTAFGQILSKQTFLCSTDYDEAYFDWHCLPGGKPPADGLDWYTVCGTPYPNHVEYCTVVISFCLFGLYMFYTMLARSGREMSPNEKVQLTFNQSTKKIE